MLSRTSVYFAISKLILLFLYSFHVSYIIISNVYFYVVRSMFPLLFNRSQSKASVVNQMSHLFLKLKIFFNFFQLFENGHIQNVVLTLINVVKLDVQNNNIVLTLSKIVNINVEIENVNLMLLNIVNFNVYVHNVVSTLIWYCLTSQSHITPTTMLRQRWNVFWVFKNVFFFSIWVFFQEHSRFTGQQGKGEGIYLTHLYHFHSLHRHLVIRGSGFESGC